MSKIVVPSAPGVELSAKVKRADAASAPAPGLTAALDAGFLARIYRSMLWFGLVLTVLVAVGLKSVPPVTSFVAGLLLAAVLLRAQEVGVRTLMRPAQETGGIDTKLILVLLMPLKILVVGAALAALNVFGLIIPAYLGVGFFAGQLVIVAKVVGLMATTGRSEIIFRFSLSVSF